MATKWTDAQSNGIYAEGGNILVSAAAGSGKTAVLVNRVIEKITKTDNPINVDSLLVVTFTNSAAAEMKSRISSSLRKKLAQDPSNTNIRKQLSLLASAQISSIDSFCLSLVKENFFKLSLPSDFSVLDENENDIIIDNAIETVIDKYYEKQNEDFLLVMRAMTKPGNDSQFVDTIKNLLTFIFAQAYPFKWYDKMTEYYNPKTSFSNTIWCKYLDENINYLIDKALEINQSCCDFIPNDDDYSKLNEIFENDKSLIFALKSSESKGLSYLIKQFPMSFMRLTPRKSYDEDVFKYVKILRSNYKDICSGIKSYIISTEDDYSQDAQFLYPSFKVIGSILRDVYDEAMKIKMDKATFSFSDIEHFAISLLFDIDKDGKIISTDEAKELSQKYNEILVDEYQDTNEVQDNLFEFLSNGKNMFMVGDVKQSIYRFRLAMPQIFVKKKNSFCIYNKKNSTFPATINLDTNFRSRNGICDFVNHVFSQYMTTQCGDIDYNKSEFLNYGGSYDNTDVPCAQLNILTGVKTKDMDEYEATNIARTIKSKIDSKELITDKNTGNMRPIKYGDIVILMRSLKSHVTAYVDVLRKFGIPVSGTNSVSLFDNAEIQMLISLLRVIDNPTRDIELLSVLLSPIYGFTADDIADIRINRKNGNLYSAVVAYKSAKTDDFIADISSLKKISVSMSMASFVRFLASQKNIYAYSYAMGDGEQREQNIEKFINIASHFDSGENVGTTSFLRYIDSIKNSGKPTESANISSNGENCVRIMSIHGSKGLEFPICILAGSARKYNLSDRNTKQIITDSEYGFSMKCSDNDGFYKYNSIPYVVLQNAISRSMASESLRVLYVAMTRAKEQFIVFSTLESDSRITKLASYVLDGKPLPYYCTYGIKSDSDYIIMSALQHKDGGALRDIANIDIPVCDTGREFDMKINIKDEIELCQEYEEPIEEKYNKEIISQIEDKLSLTYKYSQLGLISAKRSASMLDSVDADLQYVASSKPAFMSKSGLTPAQRGTAMHTFMQYCNYKNARDDIESEISAITSSGHISEEEALSLDRKKLNLLFHGDFGKRIFSSLKIHREIKLSSFVKVSEVESIKSDDDIFVQGIADCIFEENDGLVLVDYKTDNVKNENQLLERYENQLRFYKSAAHKVLQKPVKEVFLYSFSLSKPCKYTNL